MRSTFTSATCPECNTTFDGVPVEFDGDQGYGVIETQPCGECGTMLCHECAAFSCDACGQRCCLEHQTIVADEKMGALKCCSECVDAFAAQDEDAEPALACPACLGTDLRAVAYDFTERETGYHDAGERFECRSCGNAGDAGELVPLVMANAKPMGIAAVAVPSEGESKEVA
jgi:hypothetical protein